MAILKFETQKAPSLINEKELADLNKGDQFWHSSTSSETSFSNLQSLDNLILYAWFNFPEIT